MSAGAERVRLLPWTGAHGQPCLLLMDGDSSASRLADRIEDQQLGLARRLLSRTRDVLAVGGVQRAELDLLAAQLADALSDALLIARSRGARLGGRQPTLPDDGVLAVSSPLGAIHDVSAYRPAGLRAYGLLTLAGRDLGAARVARHYVRDTARTWGLPASVTDDLESIAAELVANALEHSDSCSLTVTCALAEDTTTISVTDEGNGSAPVALAPPNVPDPEQEHGRGLLITDALAVRWGSRRSGNGLTVWAELLIDAARGAVRRRRRTTPTATTPSAGTPSPAPTTGASATMTRA